MISLLFFWICQFVEPENIGLPIYRYKIKQLKHKNLRKNLRASLCMSRSNNEGYIMVGCY